MQQPVTLSTPRLLLQPRKEQMGHVGSFPANEALNDRARRKLDFFRRGL